MLLRSAILGLLLSGAAALPLPALARAPYTPDTTAPSAQSCPRDTVVWVNTRSGVYHTPGMRWFGRTAQGEYMCRREADQKGYRPTRNGQ